MKILLKQHKTATHKVCLFVLNGNTAVKKGVNKLWEVRSYKTTTWWQRLFGGSTLEGVQTTTNDAIRFFSEVVAKLEKQEKAVPIEVKTKFSNMGMTEPQSITMIKTKNVWCSCGEKEQLAPIFGSVQKYEKNEEWQCLKCRSIIVVERSEKGGDNAR